MKVVTWNVRHGRPRRGFTSNRALARAVAALDADVLAVQEVERHVIRSWFADQPANVARAAGATSSYYAKARRLPVTGSDGIALSLRGEASFRRVSLPHEWGQARVAIVAETNGLTIITTHLQNHADEARIQLGWLLEELAPLTGPRILLGDLNLRSEDVVEPLAAAGFTHLGGGPTNPAWDPVQQIDHIAVAGLEVDSVEVGPAPISDHRPLIATIRR